MWVFLDKFGIKPFEIDQISTEDQNVLWTMIKYEQERKEQDDWKEQSKQNVKQNLH